MKRVALIAATREGLLLMGKRNDNSEWTMPGGGVHEEETPLEGALRELYEETGLSPTFESKEMKLVDEREVNGVMFYTFECEVDEGTPTSKNDPDNECGEWAFFDIEKGIPKDVASNMVGPKNKEDNVLSEMYGLEKMQRLVGFPRLGIENRRETPFVDTQQQARHKLEQMTSAVVPAVSLKPGAVEKLGVPELKIKQNVARDYSKDIMRSSYGMVMGAPPMGPEHNVSYAYTNNARNMLHMAGPRSNTSDVATKLHEDFHQMMHRVELKHGHQARINLAQNLWNSIPAKVRNVAGFFVRQRNRSVAGDPFEHEEHLAILHNYLNDPHERMWFENNARLTPEFNRQLHTSMKQSLRHVNDTMRQVDESWLKPRIEGQLASPPAEAIPQQPKPPGRIGPQPSPKKPEILRDAEQEAPNLFKCSIAPWDSPATDPDGWLENKGLTKTEHDDEVDRLLMHPNVTERRMALKLGSVGEKHLIRALEDEDPDVQRAAFTHPGMSANVLHALMRMPNREHLQQLALDHPKAGIDHVNTLYNNHKHNHKLLNAITNSAHLDSPTIQRIYEDGNATRSLVANLRAPQEMIQQIIEKHFAPGEDKLGPERYLTMEALKHPHAPPHLVEKAIKEGDDGIRLAAAESANLPAGVAEDILKRGQLPTNGHEAFLRHALVSSKHASPKQLMMGLDDSHPRVRASVFTTKSPHLNVSHVDRAIEKNDPMLIALAMNTPHAGQQHVQKMLESKHPEIRQIGEHHSLKRAAEVKKFEGDLSGWLNKNDLKKATQPLDFAGIVQASDPEGRALVDHKPHLESHPVEHSSFVQAYRQNVLTSPEKVKRKSFSDRGISRKHIYAIPPTVQSHGGQTYMIKPYHERPIRRLQTWSRHPHQGWAEMAHQALYHAAGIGDLHQKVHISEHNMGNDLPNEPAVVIAMEKDHRPISELGYGANIEAQKNPAVGEQARKIALMDFLTNNIDRHGGNLMMKWNYPEKRMENLLAIDHGRSFQYQNTHEHKWRGARQTPKNIDDSFGPYIERSAIDIVDPKLDPVGRPNMYDQKMHNLERYAPIIQWWGEVGPKVRESMGKQLEQIRDPQIRDHIRRNFETRADWLDERANLGLENYGVDWYKDPVNLFKPGQLTDEEMAARERGENASQGL